jgi:outer membrane protein
MKLKFSLNSSLALIISTLLASSSFAGNSYYVDNQEQQQNEKQVTIKLKGGTIIAPSKGKGLPNSNTGKPVNQNLIANGFHGEVAATIFFSTNLAAEVSAGFSGYKTKQSVLNDVSTAYGGNSAKKLNIYSIPINFILQYHIAPYGGISPYIGAGYNVSYFYSACKAIKVDKISSGPIVQLGVDFLAQDNTLFNIEIKKLWLSNKAQYLKSFTGQPNNLPSKIKIDPLIISLGIGFKF